MTTEKVLFQNNYYLSEILNTITLPGNYVKTNKMKRIDRSPVSKTFENQQ